jgi:hypothetical protein
MRIVCVPAASEADELAAVMLAQLLKGLGSEVRILPVASRANFVNEVTTDSTDVAIVSALPPFATGHGKSLCKRLRRQQPDLKVMLGLWSFDGGIAKAQERIGSGCADMVATSLEQAIASLAQGGQLTSTNEQSRGQSPSLA